MPLCFAYGSNLDGTAMAARCPGSWPRGLARLERYRLAVMREGYLTVVPDARAAVHGLLWEVTLADMPALDRYEEVARGLYRKRHLAVITLAGPRQSIVYVGANAGPGLPRPGYLEAVLAAARDVGLPARALAELAALASARQSRDAAAVRASALDAPAVRPTRRTPLDPPAGRAALDWRWEP